MTNFAFHVFESACLVVIIAGQVVGGVRLSRSRDQIRTWLHLPSKTP